MKIQEEPQLTPEDILDLSEKKSKVPIVYLFLKTFRKWLSKLYPLLESADEVTFSKIPASEKSIYEIVYPPTDFYISVVVKAQHLDTFLSLVTYFRKPINGYKIISESLCEDESKMEIYKIQVHYGLVAKLPVTAKEFLTMSWIMELEQISQSWNMDNSGDQVLRNPYWHEFQVMKYGLYLTHLMNSRPCLRTVLNFINELTKKSTEMNYTGNPSRGLSSITSKFIHEGGIYYPYLNWSEGDNIPNTKITNLLITSV